MEPDEEEYKSKSQLKREANALQDLGEELIELAPADLERIPMEDRLREAILDARSMTRGALKRQRQLIGKLMRETDPAPIVQALDTRRQKAMESVRRFHQLEALRDQLIESGDHAMGDVLERYPNADRQQLRQLTRQAQKEATQGKPNASRALFRYLKALEDSTTD
jgi:ribosome-associated protein